MNALIILGGDRPSAGLLRTLAGQAELVLCADSGLAAAQAAGVVPDAVIGDMDSVPDEALRRYAQAGNVLRLPCEKDDTDGVAALDEAIRRGAAHVTLTGALGGRLDHALANCMLLVRAYNRGITACIEEDAERVELLRGRREIFGRPGQTFSLLSLGEARIASLTGAHYPLHDYAMSCDHPIGVSNLFEQPVICVDIAQGDVLFFQQNRL